jgi:hypothetical protein
LGLITAQQARLVALAPVGLSMNFSAIRPGNATDAAVLWSLSVA